RDRQCMLMSEFGVVAVPGAIPDTMAAEPNIGDPVLGGRLISTTFEIGARTEKNLFNAAAWRINVTEEGALAPTDILIGFWRDRIAQIDRIEWSMVDQTDETAVTQFEVLAVDSILAPPVSIGFLDAPAPGDVTVFDLPDGTMARYLILRADLPEGRNHVYGAISVFERAAQTGEYLSILGTWDEDDRKGPVEWFNPPVVADLPQKITSSQSAPADLLAKETVASHTHKEAAPDWFRLVADPDAADDEVWRVLTLSAPEILEVGAVLTAGDGTEVPLVSLPDLRKADDPIVEDVNALDLGIPDGFRDDLTFLARVDPKQDYTLRIAEEARLLIMRRERTDMLSNVDMVRQRAYAELADLLGDGRDAMDIGVPDLEGEMLLRGRDNILLAMTRLPDPTRDTGIGTSDFGTAVAASADTLRHWPGGKSIVYFGMGGGIMAVEDMDWVHKVQDVPVRTVSVMAPCNEGAFFCPDPAEAELNALTFAASTGGTFTRTTSRASLRAALLDAATAMTGPKPYAVSWQDVPVPPPLASLTITLSETEIAQASAVAAGPPSLAIILDASGSMLRRLDGTRRIAIAQAALTDLIQTTVPEGTQVSFRAFGLAEDACDTANLSPLAPMDRTALSDAINGVRAINLAKTPIADSIRAAATDDLAAATGPRAIILLTDGEETCDGDVAGTLTALQADGINITLSIVGFAIDDAALKADFDRWADLGNGAYFDAGNQAGLQTALSDALAEVAPDPIPTQSMILSLDDPDIAVITAAMGEAVTLPAGRYQITLDTGAEYTVDVAAGDEISLTTAEFRPAE
ncbi:MAG: VWA domain-containing protein, partial [Pseudomonadota bacterium]